MRYVKELMARISQMRILLSARMAGKYGRYIWMLPIVPILILVLCILIGRGDQQMAVQGKVKEVELLVLTAR